MMLQRLITTILSKQPATFRLSTQTTLFELFTIYIIAIRCDKFMKVRWLLFNSRLHFK